MPLSTPSRYKEILSLPTKIFEFDFLDNFTYFAYIRIFKVLVMVNITSPLNILDKKHGEKMNLNINITTYLLLRCHT